MKWDARKAHRVRFEHECRVNLMGVDGTWRRQCRLLDISETGAKLQVEGCLEALKAQEFFLVLSSAGLAFRRCELVWIDGRLAGVKFVAMASRKKNRAAEPL